MWYTSDSDPEQASRDALYAYNSFQAAKTRLEEMQQENAEPHMIEGQREIVTARARKANEAYAHMKELDKRFGHGQQVHTEHSWRQQ